ncbi:hypothetical protein IAT38_004317 [Cryptococcus sp. DSM 104549]
MPRVRPQALAALLLASTALAQSTTTSADSTHYTASSALKLAKSWSGSDFYSDWDYFTDDDPTNGYVNYVSKSAGTDAGLVDVQANDVFIMRADSDNVATGRGRDSIRISSKDKFADGVYILDLNHMPVGCGTWPAWWTVVKTGWPIGGEIDIIEGANGLNTSGSPDIYNAASLHTSDACTITGGSYMDGQVGSTVCSAYAEGNIGCGITMDGGGQWGTNGSYGAGVNTGGGGWFAMWRDMEADGSSGGVYVWYWPRTSTKVPADVVDSATSTTDLSGWGTPNANLSVPTCKTDFGNHVIVFDLTFCGDYAGATYTSSGCPGTCETFVKNYPAAYAEAYWSINSLRVYTASGKPASSGSSLSTGAIVGIAIGSAVGVAILGFGLWVCLKRRRAQRSSTADTAPSAPEPYALLAGRKPRVGPTKLAPGKTARHYLEGETPTQLYGRGTGSQRGDDSPGASSSDIKLVDTSAFVAPQARKAGVKPKTSTSTLQQHQAPMGTNSWIG